MELFMVVPFKKPKDDVELQKREAAGLWNAQILAKKIAESSEKISIEVILRIHRIFQQNANPLIAGRLRAVGEDIKKLKCMTPPLGSAVSQEMYVFWRDFDTRMAQIPIEIQSKTSKVILKKRNGAIINLAAWTQYEIARIHPFCEGNGRMARLMTNLILRRYNLQPSDIKYEGENRQKYLAALCEIDQVRDFRSLEQLIIKGITASYQKLIRAKKNHK